MKNKFIAKVFQWLCIGLLVTFGLGYVITLSEALTLALLNIFPIIAIAEIVIGIIFSIRLEKMSNITAKILYLAYAALTGVTFTILFLIYEISSILWVIFATAIIFGIFALIGKKIKIDLSNFGTFLFIALLGMIFLSILNMFLLNSSLDMTICFVSILIFCGYITYDINKIIKLSKFKLEEKYAIFGAFQLYLDLINIIIDLLNLTGESKD